MIADLPPLRTMERHYQHSHGGGNGSLTQGRVVQSANGTKLFVFVVCKTYEYGVVSAPYMLSISIQRVVTLCVHPESLQ